MKEKKEKISQRIQTWHGEKKNERKKRRRKGRRKTKIKACKKNANDKLTGN